MEHIFSESEAIKGVKVLVAIEVALDRLLSQHKDKEFMKGITPLSFDKVDVEKFSTISSEDDFNVIFMKKRKLIFAFHYKGIFSGDMYLLFGPINPKSFYNSFEVRVSLDKEDGNHDNLENDVLNFLKKVLQEISLEVRKFL